MKVAKRHIKENKISKHKTCKMKRMSGADCKKTKSCKKKKKKKKYCKKKKKKKENEIFPMKCHLY